ncbi:hypothetical protein [Streptomyces sp. NPDC005732]|uniref:DUF6919 domain-containing protein n=1 Tax=Streptomyces sp. NPDC005732 TaxID=3157057 RepID=UPI0033CBEADB
MASWLEGDVSVWPGYEPGFGPDEETTELIPTLVAANRAGFVTEASQPGCDEVDAGGVRWLQSAAVSGLVGDVQLLAQIRRACEQAGLIVMMHHPTLGLWSHQTPVTWRGDEPHTWFGGQLTASDLRHIWRGLRPEALDAVVNAWQVTAIDPEYGRNDRLWPALDEAAGRTVAAP